jgi:hypothetical protein
MANTRKGVKQLKHFQPSDIGHAAHQAQVPHGHARDDASQRKESSLATGAQRGRFAPQAPKGPRKGQ